MSVEYTKEQAEQVIKDYNIYDGYSQLNEDYSDFLNHKFPPKIEYVGKVWKIENRIFLCTSQNKGGTLYGYGIGGGAWFLRQSGARCCCNQHFLNDLTKATQEEWMEALEKFAESKYNEGDEVRCLSDEHLEIIGAISSSDIKDPEKLSQYWGECKHFNGANIKLMKDGIWADIITPAKDELNEKLEELTKLAESQGKNLKITFEKQ